MFSRRIAVARPLARAIRPTSTARSFAITSRLRASEADPDAVDPGMNGGYVNPAPVKRILRDPYADWWDKQERRNYGEPVHEDNDVLGMFTTEVYSWTNPAWGSVLMGTFIATFLGVVGVVYLNFPEKPSVPRTFPDGLEKELGGKGALTARRDGEEFTL